MQCGQGKPFTVTSTNSKMGSTAVRSYEKGGVVKKPDSDSKNSGGPLGRSPLGDDADSGGPLGRSPLGDDADSGGPLGRSYMKMPNRNPQGDKPKPETMPNKNPQSGKPEMVKTPNFRVLSKRNFD